MRLRTGRTLAGAAVGLTAAFALAACGGSGSGSAAAGSASGAASSSQSGSSPSASQATGTTVQVKATEFAFSLSTTDLGPGTYTFTMDNAGHATHAMEIEGPGLEDKASSTAGPGGTATLTVRLQPGTYELYCPVGNHRQQGMQTTLTVK